MERNRAAELALGRILRLGSRPEQPGDGEAYERARKAFVDAIGAEPYYRPVVSWVRDRNKGAAGA